MPVPVEEQIIIIYAAVNGMMDEVQVGRVKEFEKKLISYIRSIDPELFKTLKELPKLTEEKLKQHINKFKETF